MGLNLNLYFGFEIGLVAFWIWPCGAQRGGSKITCRGSGFELVVGGGFIQTSVLAGSWFQLSFGSNFEFGR